MHLVMLRKNSTTQEGQIRAASSHCWLEVVDLSVTEQEPDLSPSADNSEFNA